MSAARKKPSTEVLSIRMPRQLQERLDSEAEELGIKASQHARRLIIERLTEGDSVLVSRIEELEAQVEDQAANMLELTRSVQQMRQALAESTKAILVNVLPKEQHEGIRDWVAATLMPEQDS